MIIHFSLKRKMSILSIIILLFCTTSCYSSGDLDYYANKDNYIYATGTVSHIKYSESLDELYLAFSDLSPDFDDNNFKIVGENLSIVQEQGIDEKLQLGNDVVFISAPLYLGDGYVMPIVGIEVNGETLLDFEEGFKNFQTWLIEQ